MSSLSPEGPQFSVNITCPKCRAIGVVVWEKDGAHRSLVSLSNGFYERMSEKDPYPIELVCRECGTRKSEE